MKNKTNIICEGLILGQSGFGEALRNVIISLDKMGCNIKAKSVAEWDEDNVDVKEDETFKRILVLKDNELKDEESKIWITMIDPLGCRIRPNHYSVAYCMFETEVFPEVFANHLKNHKEIWTPSTFCKDTMEAAGLRNVQVMPLGVNVKRFNPDIEPLPCPPELEGKYKFLSIFGWSERKGVDLLIKAYTEEFRYDKDVVLYLKGGWYSARRAERETYRYVKNLPYPHPLIRTDFKCYSLKELPQLYKMCDCFVMPTRGEGWGLEYSEAMAMEMPTIATNWGGQLEFMNHENSYLIQNDGTKEHPGLEWICPQYLNAKFGNPNKDDLKRLMRFVYENRDEAKAKGKYARQFMIDNFTWDKSMSKVYKRIKEISSMFEVKKPAAEVVTHKRALVTGCDGQDGAYLSKLLLEKGYDVYGLVRHVVNRRHDNLDYLGITEKVKFLNGDLTDEESLNNAVKISQPDEVYNLAAQSFVGKSWECPVSTTEINGVGVLKLLNAIRHNKPDARYYQASTSEMFGNSKTELKPRSPYGIAKLFAHWTTINFRESYGMFACCGTLFNHESPLRGLEFVTRKITDGVARIKLGLATGITLGNLDSYRDWGFAGDYVKAMWMMLQQDNPDDFIIATGESHSIREFLTEAFKCVGIDDWMPYVTSDSKFKRLAEVDHLCGDSSKAQNVLGWRPEVGFKELVRIMIKADLKRLQDENSMGIDVDTVQGQEDLAQGFMDQGLHQHPVA